MVRSVQHEMLAVPTADETARQQFVVAFKQALNRGLRKTQGDLFETVVAPGWAAEHGAPPTTRETIREAMQADPAYRSWSSLARAAQEQMWITVGDSIFRERERLATTAERLAQAPAATMLTPGIHQAFERAVTVFAQHPQARILWAHAGFERPEAVRAMLRRHPRLWADLAFRNDPGSGSEVDPAWREAFMEFPERFMLGTDTFTPERLHYIPVHAEWARGWLAALPPALAERIAWRNAEALLLPVWQANRAAVDPAPDCPAPAEGWRLASATLALSVRPEPASPRVGEPFSLHIALCPAAGGRTVDSLLVDATMPEHRHGMNYRPQVHRVDARHFRADGLLLHMPGRWELVLETRGAAGGERLTQEIRLP